MRAFKWIGGIIVLLVIIGVLAGKKDDQTSSASTPASAPTTQVASALIPIPDDEKSFIDAVERAQKASSAAANDMQKGGVRTVRATDVCSVLKSGVISGWVGKAVTVDANSDGKGVLQIIVGDGIKIGTWNNALSDVTDKTLIEPGTDLFARASQLKRRQDVKFSGSFLQSDLDCIEESSLSLDGSLKSPEYIFRFADVGPL